MKLLTTTDSVERMVMIVLTERTAQLMARRDETNAIRHANRIAAFIRKMLK